MMKIRFWGTRGSIATPGKQTVKYGGNTSCVEVRAGSHIMIFDCGTGIRELGISLEKEFADKPLHVHLFISHTHWDHIQGFPFFLPAYTEGNTIDLYGPPGRDKPFESIVRSQMESDYFPVSLGDMKANIQVHELREPVQIENVRVSHLYLNHPAMTLGYRVSQGKKSVVYATDNEPYKYTLHEAAKDATVLKDYGNHLDEQFISFIAGTDLFIAEAQYTMEEYQSGKMGWGHSPIESVVEFASRGKVKRIAFYHHDPLHDDDEVDAMIRHARKLLRNGKKRIECFGAREGLEVSIR
jgi:phosphoribosyl 1,2-cyclic phosphodiesterase